MQLQDTQQGATSSYLMLIEIKHKTALSKEVYSYYKLQELRVLYKTTDA